MTNLTSREANSVYLERLIFMTLLLVASAYLQGGRVILIAVLSVLLCMIVDAICCFLRKIQYNIKDMAVPFWGIGMAAMMSSATSIPAVILGSVICIAVGKHMFGASDNIVFSPPAIAAAFMMICYPADMLYFTKFGEKYPISGEWTGTFARSADYSLKMGNPPTGSIFDILLGRVPAAIATGYILIIAICCVCLVIRRSNSLGAILSCFAVVGIMAFFFPRTDSVSKAMSIFYELTSGYVFFGTVFLAAEPYRMPQRPMGRVLYGAVLGYITMMFRFYGQTEGSFLFALLITTALTNSFDRVIDNLIYWKKTYLNSFEKNKNRVQRGEIKITDTQEIEIPEKYKYNTPPIDGKIKKRHKQKNADKEEQEKNEPKQNNDKS